MMLITEITHGEYKLQMSDEELEHFRILIVGSENLLISDISSMITYILTWCEQHWYDSVHEDRAYDNQNPGP